MDCSRIADVFLLIISIANISVYEDSAIAFHQLSNVRAVNR